MNLRILDDDVVNKIAAGEVVDRPASVLKELLENALDAGAKNIKIRLEEGGRRSLTITDDGCGIPASDQNLVLKRHATSKIEKAEDLFQISSMGFRGEALAAISSVSRFTLNSRQSQAENGFTLKEDQGKSYTQSWGGQPGTIISVEDLFYNIPARLRFLKSAASEWAACAEVFQAIALAHPEVAFELWHNDKERFRLRAQAPGAQLQETQARAAELWGKNCPELMFFSNKNDYGTVRGLCSSPSQDKSNRKFMLNFINGRWVKDNLLSFSILQAYQGHLLKGRFPVCLMYFECDPSLVDVNVHPAKAEVRFEFPSEARSLVTDGIRRVLRRSDWSRPPVEPPKTEPKLSPPSSPSPSTTSPSPSISSPPPPVSGSSETVLPIAPTIRPIENETPTTVGAAALAEDEVLPTAVEEEQPPKAGATVLFPDIKPKVSKTPPFDWRRLEYLGCFRACYLIFQERNKLLFIDQHAFHERILFEQLSSNSDLLLVSQNLLIPELIELEPKSLEYLQAHKERFFERGFCYAFHDELTLEVKSVPKILVGKNLDQVFAKLGEYGAGYRGSDVDSLAHDELATMACHGAVRAGESLSESSLKDLLTIAETVDFYANCPHGRPVFYWLGERELQGWFQRG